MNKAKGLSQKDNPFALFIVVRAGHDENPSFDDRAQQGRTAEQSDAGPEGEGAARVIPASPPLIHQSMYFKQSFQPLPYYLPDYARSAYSCASKMKKSALWMLAS